MATLPPVVAMPRHSGKVMQKAASHQPTDASAHFERYEEQLQALHAQVDDLQIQLLQQSQAQVLIQADCQLQVSLLRDKLEHVSKHAEACNASAHVTYSHLATLRLALPGHHAQSLAAITGLAQQLVRDSDLLVTSCNTEVTAQSPGGKNIETLPASDQTAAVSWLHEQLLLSQERELELKQQLVEAHNVFMALEQEVAVLHRQQMAASEQLKASSQDMDKARSSFIAAVAALRDSNAVDANVDKAYELLDKGLKRLDVHAANMDDILNEVDSTEPSATKPARPAALGTPIDASALRASLLSAAPIQTHVTVSASRLGTVSVRRAAHRSMQPALHDDLSMGGVALDVLGDADVDVDVGTPRDQTPRTTASRRATGEPRAFLSRRGTRESISPPHMRVAPAWGAMADDRSRGHSPANAVSALADATAKAKPRRSSSAPASPRGTEGGGSSSGGARGGYRHRPGRRLRRHSSDASEASGTSGGGMNAAAMAKLADQVNEAASRGVGPVRPPSTAATATQTGRSCAGGAPPVAETQTGRSLAGADPAILAALEPRLAVQVAGPAAHMASIAEAAEAMRQRAAATAAADIESDRQRELEKLRSALAAAESWRDKHQAKAAEQAKELAAAMDDIQQLQEQVAKQCALSERQDAANTSLQADLREAKDFLARTQVQAEEAARAAAEQQASLQARCEALEEERARLLGYGEENMSLKAEIEPLTAKYEAAEAQLQEMRDAAEREQAVHELLKEELCQTQLQLAQAHAKVIELEGLLHESQDVVRLRGDELSNLQLQLATKQAELAVGMAEMDQLRLRLQEQEGQLQQSASEAAELTAELESARKQVVSGAVELVDIRDRMAANDTEVAQMRGQHEAMVARVAAAEALAKQHATGVKALQHQLSAEHEKLATQANQLMAANEEVRKQAAEIANLQCKLEMSSDELLAAREQLKLAHQQAAVQLADQLRTAKELEAATQETAAQQSQLQSLQRQLAAEMQLSADQAAELCRTHEELAAQERILFELRSRDELVSAELQASRGKLLDTHEQTATAAVELQAAQEQLAQREADVAQLRDELAAAQSELQGALRRLCEAQEHAALQAADAEFINAQLAKATADAEEARTQAAAAAAALEAREHKVAALAAQAAEAQQGKDQLTARSAELATLRVDLLQTQEQLASAQRLVTERDDRLVELLRELDSQQKQFTALRFQADQTCESLKSKSALLADAETELASLRAFKDIKNEYADRISALEAELAAAAEVVEQLQGQLQAAEEGQEAASDDAADLREQLAASGRELQAVRDELAAAQALAAERAREIFTQGEHLLLVQTELAILQQQVADREAELSGLTDAAQLAAATADSEKRQVLSSQEQLRARAEDVVKRQAAAEAEIANLRVSLAEMDTTLTLVTRERDRCSKDFHAAQARLKSVIRELESTNAAKVKLQCDLAAAQSGLQTHLVDAVAVRDDAVMQLERMEGHIARLEQELDRLRSELSRAQAEAKAEAKTPEPLRVDMATITDELGSPDQVSSPSASEVDLRIQLLSALSEIATLRTELQTLGGRAHATIGALQARLGEGSIGVASARATRTTASSVVSGADVRSVSSCSGSPAKLLEKVAELELQTMLQDCNEQYDAVCGLKDRARALQSQLSAAAGDAAVVYEIVADIQPLLAEVDQLISQGTRLAETQGGLRTALAEALAAGQAAIGKVDSYKAKAESARAELVRARSTYHESQRTLHALHEESQRLNQQLWQQNTQLTIERDQLLERLQLSRPTSTSGLARSEKTSPAVSAGGAPAGLPPRPPTKASAGGCRVPDCVADGISRVNTTGGSSVNSSQWVSARGSEFSLGGQSTASLGSSVAPNPAPQTAIVNELAVPTQLPPGSPLRTDGSDTMSAPNSDGGAPSEHSSDAGRSYRADSLIAPTDSDSMSMLSVGGPVAVASNGGASTVRSRASAPSVRSRASVTPPESVAMPSDGGAPSECAAVAAAAAVSLGSVAPSEGGVLPTRPSMGAYLMPSVSARYSLGSAAPLETAMSAYPLPSETGAGHAEPAGAIPDTASQGGSQGARDTLCERESVMEVLETQLSELSGDIRTFETMVERVEALTEAMSRSRGGSTARSSASSLAGASQGPTSP